MELRGTARGSEAMFCSHPQPVTTPTEKLDLQYREQRDWGSRTAEGRSDEWAPWTLVGCDLQPPSRRASEWGQEAGARAALDRSPACRGGAEGWEWRHRRQVVEGPAPAPPEPCLLRWARAVGGKRKRTRVPNRWQADKYSEEAVKIWGRDRFGNELRESADFSESRWPSDPFGCESDFLDANRLRESEPKTLTADLDCS
jgi:hypothetical protein